jgi:hypothetical protein
MNPDEMTESSPSREEAFPKLSEEKRRSAAR